MANELETQIIRILTETRDEIRANMEAKKINSSGRTSASLRVEKFEGGYRLVGGTNTTHKVNDYPYGDAQANDTAPIPTLEFGRSGGGNPPVPRGFYYIIREWSREKGINFASEKERSTFAYFLSRKIAREGTRRNTSHEDVYSTPVMLARQRIEQAINASISNTIRAALGQTEVSSIRGAFTD